MKLFLILCLFQINELIHGLVKDQEGNPIPSVLIQSGGNYSVSNNAGEFKIELSEDKQINFQCLGFQSRSIFVESYVGFLDVVLTTATYLLPEVEVVYLKPEEIFQKARDLLFIQYHGSPSLSRYELGNRVKISTPSGSYYSDRFILFDRYSPHVRRLPEFRILESKVSEPEFWKDHQEFISTNFFSYVNRFFFEGSHWPDFFLDWNFRKYSYELLYEDERHYLIQVSSKGKKLHEDGKLWIEKETFLINKCNIWINEHGLKAYFTNSNLKTKSMMGFSAHLLSHELLFELEHLNGKQVIKNVDYFVRTKLNFKDDSEFITNQTTKLILNRVLSPENYKEGEFLKDSEVRNIDSLFLKKNANHSFQIEMNREFTQ